jgi:hypothetical protein
MKSTDGGNTWVTGNDYLDVSRITIKKDAPYTLYAVSSTSDVYKSTNDGMNWSKMTGDTYKGDTFIPGHGLIIESGASPSLFFATSAGVFRGLDGGATWETCSSGITAATVSTVCIAPSAPTNLYVGVPYYSVLKTTNAMSSSVAWQPLPKFFSCTQVNVMLIPPDNPNKIYAGGGGS